MGHRIVYYPPVAEELDRHQHFFWSNCVNGKYRWVSGEQQLALESNFDVWKFHSYGWKESDERKAERRLFRRVPKTNSKIKTNPVQFEFAFLMARLEGREFCILKGEF